MTWINKSGRFYTVLSFNIGTAGTETSIEASVGTILNI